MAETAPPSAPIETWITGIGLATARTLAREGWTVLGGRLPAQDAPSISGVEYLDLDVTDPSAIAAAARTVEDRGGLHLLVASAGLA